MVTQFMLKHRNQPILMILRPMENSTFTYEKFIEHTMFCGLQNILIDMIPILFSVDDQWIVENGKTIRFIIFCLLFAFHFQRDEALLSGFLFFIDKISADTTRWMLRKITSNQLLVNSTILAELTARNRAANEHSMPRQWWTLKNDLKISIYLGFTVFHNVYRSRP